MSLITLRFSLILYKHVPPTLRGFWLRGSVSSFPRAVGCWLTAVSCCLWNTSASLNSSWVFVSSSFCLKEMSEKRVANVRPSSIAVLVLFCGRACRKCRGGLRWEAFVNQYHICYKQCCHKAQQSDGKAAMPAKALWWYQPYPGSAQTAAAAANRTNKAFKLPHSGYWISSKAERVGRMDLD